MQKIATCLHVLDCFVNIDVKEKLDQLDTRRPAHRGKHNRCIPLHLVLQWLDLALLLILLFSCCVFYDCSLQVWIVQNKIVQNILQQVNVSSIRSSSDNIRRDFILFLWTEANEACFVELTSIVKQKLETVNITLRSCLNYVRLRSIVRLEVWKAVDGWEGSRRCLEINTLFSEELYKLCIFLLNCNLKENIVRSVWMDLRLRSDRHFPPHSLDIS